MGNFARLVAASKADSYQSPRLPNGEGKRGHSGSSSACRPAQGVQASAGAGTTSSPSGRKWVARLGGFGSQTLATAVALVTSLALLISAAQAHVPGCHSRKCDRRIHTKRVHAWCNRTPRCIWKHRWIAEDARWKEWLRSTAQCESGNRAHIATGNGYFGLVQFDYGTWHEAGGHGYPHQATWYEQAVRAVELAKRVGTGRWPVCGR